MSDWKCKDIRFIVGFVAMIKHMILNKFTYDCETLQNSPMNPESIETELHC